MKKLAKTLLVLAGLAGATLTLAAFRYGPGHHPDPSRFVTNRVEDLLDDVKATDAQRQQITAIEDKVIQDAQAIHQKQKGSHQELLDQWNAAQPDTAKIHALIDAHIEAMRAMAYEAADGVVQAHGILTPEQRAEVGRKLQKRFERMERMSPQP